MKITLTREEMLALWRRMRTVEPLRLDCSVGRTDSVDIDAILDGEMRLWYLNLLDSADPDLLPVENVADAADCSTAAPSSVMTVRLALRDKTLWGPECLLALVPLKKKETVP